MDDPSIMIDREPAESDVRLVEDQINQYNINRTGYEGYRALAGFCRDERGEIIAGLSGYTWGGFCEIKFLWVQAD